LVTCVWRFASFIIEQKEAKFINRMNLYFHDSLAVAFAQGNKLLPVRQWILNKWADIALYLAFWLTDYAEANVGV
jgi:hypothetical protein